MAEVRPMEAVKTYGGGKRESGETGERLRCPWHRSHRLLRYVLRPPIAQDDPAAGAWASLAPLPEPRQSPVSGIVGDLLIVAGGSLTQTTWRGQLEN